MAEEKEIKYNLEPPHDIEAEKAVLGSMLLNQDAVSDVIDRLRPEDFYLREHQEIYRAFTELFKKSIGIDLNTANSILKTRKTAEFVGGLVYLSRLADDAIVPTNAKYYAETVLNKSNMRQLITEADNIRSKAYDGQKPADEILDFAEQRIFEIAHKSQRNNYSDINEVFIENIRTIQELEKNKGALPGITTGFKDLDKKLGGLHKSDLIILAARPGMGKTSFALNVAENAAAAGHSVLIFSMEMPKTQLGQRILAMSACVDMERLKTGTVTADDWMAISYATDSFEDRKLFIDDNSSISILEMKNKCRRLKAEQGLDLVVIDYLQLMSLGYGTDNRVNEISAITRNIKILAKELDVAVILLSQLSRKAEDRKDRRPMLSDLRDSGSIEQDADIVIFLKRDDYYDDENEGVEINREAGSTCEVNIAKHRNGEPGSVHLAWIGRYTKFGNLERGSDFDM